MRHERQDQSVRARFSAAATTYNEVAVVQKKTATRLLELLSDESLISPVLEIGCGTGVLTELLLKSFPATQVDALDISPKMIECARTRVAAHGRVNWILEDFLAFYPRAPYPLIVSSSALHWISPVKKAFQRAADLMEPGGNLVVALMVHGTLQQIHDARLRIAPHKPPLGQLPAEQEILKSVAEAGLSLVFSRKEQFSECFPSAAALLQALHSQGVTGGPFSAAPYRLTRGELKKLTAAYESECRDNKTGVVASYDVLYFKAQKLS